MSTGRAGGGSGGLTDEEIIAEAIEKVSEQTATWESRELGEAVCSFASTRTYSDRRSPRPLFLL